MSIGKRPHNKDIQYDGTKKLTTEFKDGKVEVSTTEDSIDYKSAVNIQDPNSANPNADWLHTIKDFAGNIIMGIDRYGRSFWYGTSGFASGIMQFFSNGKLYAIFSTDGGDGFFKLFDSNNEDIRFSIDGKLEGISNIPVSQKEVIQVIKPILDSIGVDYEFKNTEELRTLGGTPSNQGGVPKGAVLGETVYLNSEEITLDTPIHELGHLWINKSKLSNPELYNKGMDLINSPEGATYLQYVRETQPSLEENTVGFYEEALAQAIGDNGARFIDAKRKKSFSDWVNSLFKWISEQVGISDVSPEKLQTMKLKDFATAVAIETLKTNTVAGTLEASQRLHRHWRSSRSDQQETHFTRQAPLWGVRMDTSRAGDG